MAKPTRGKPAAHGGGMKKPPHPGKPAAPAAKPAVNAAPAKPTAGASPGRAKPAHAGAHPGNGSAPRKGAAPAAGVKAGAAKPSKAAMPPSRLPHKIGKNIAPQPAARIHPRIAPRPHEPPPQVQSTQGMTKKSPLKKNELTRFKDLLLAKREALVGDVKSMESQAMRASDTDSGPNHMADFGSDAYEQDFTLGLIESDEKVITQINDALARLERGDYGICEGCGNEIPPARLEVLPWTAFCIKCQEQNERGG